MQRNRRINQNDTRLGHAGMLAAGKAVRDKIEEGANIAAYLTQRSTGSRCQRQGGDNWKSAGRGRVSGGMKRSRSINPGGQDQGQFPGDEEEARNEPKRTKKADPLRQQGDQILADARREAEGICAEIARAEYQVHQLQGLLSAAVLYVDKKKKALSRCISCITGLEQGRITPVTPSGKFTLRLYRLSGQCIKLPGCKAATLVEELLRRVARESQHLLPDARMEDVKIVRGLFTLSATESRRSLGELGIGPDTLLNVVLTDGILDWLIDKTEREQ